MLSRYNAAGAGCQCAGKDRVFQMSPGGPLRRCIDDAAPSSAGLSGLPAMHRGALALDSCACSSGVPVPASGPDTPPPSSGDWTVDEAGNNVNNTTIVLNGNLTVTTGDLSLDNVTLVMNCTADGQYGVDVGSGGALNLTCCNITAFSGSRHFKFAVRGCMTMDRCDVSELYGDVNLPGVPSGITLYSSGALIRSSTISEGATSGVQVRGNSAPSISGTSFVRNGFKAVSVMDSAAPAVTNCTFLNTTSRSISTNNTSKPVFRDCRVSGDGSTAIAVFDSAFPVFRNCTVAGSTEYGLYLDDTSRTAASGCRFFGNGYSGIILYTTAACAFDNCTADGNGISGIQVPGRAGHTLTGCVFNGNLGNGLETVFDSDPVITNCNVSGNNQTGIFTTDTSTPVIRGCTASGNLHNGMQGSTAARPTVTDCNFSGNVGCGFSVDTTSSPTILMTSAQDNEGHGAQIIGSSTPSISDCTFSGNVMNGIQSSILSTGVITNCSFFSNEGSGLITTDTSQPVIAGCMFRGNNQSGLTSWDTSAPAVDNCTFTNNIGYGLEVIGSARTTARDCHSYRNNQSGFCAAETSAPVFTRCRSEDNYGCGITVFHSAAPSISDCYCSGNVASGLQLTEFAKATATNCTLAGNRWHGVASYHWSAPEIRGCRIESNGGSGVLVAQNAAPLVEGCSIKGQTYMGMYVCEFSTPVIRDSAITDNNQTGLDVLDSSSPRLSGITLSGNGGQNLWVTTTKPVVLANSTLAGGSAWDVQLSNSSRLTLLNTTFTKRALLTGTAQLRVQWYLTFTVLDRARRPVPGALVGGNGMNGSLIAPVASGPDGVARDLVATEYQQNGTGSESEYTCFSPYDITVAKDGEANVTRAIPASRTLSWKVFLDYAPVLAPIPVQYVTEDRPACLDITSFLGDPDDPLCALGLWTDRDFASVDNATKLLTIAYTANRAADSFTLTLSDGLRNCSRPVELLVSIVNDPPECFEPVPDLSVLEDGTLTIDLAAHMRDEESGSRLEFACNREELSIDNVQRTANWTPGEGNGSLEGVYFTASDGSLEGVSNEFNITFIPVNDPPVYLGGLEDRTVQEHRNWTADLLKYFWDEEDAGALVFECGCAEITVNNIRHTASWSPSGNSSYSVEAVFTAHDAANYSMTASSGPITLTYVPVNDPPVYLGKLSGARLKPGEAWNITLEDQFQDEDTEFLRFSASSPDVRIIEASKGRHYAVWAPDRYSRDVKGLFFTAYDGKTYVKSSPIDLRLELPVEPPSPEPAIAIVGMVPWYIYALVPAGVAAGALAFYGYRRVKYGRYEVEQVFLINKDGRLLAHRSRKPLPGGGEDIVSGMLTALQGFIKEFLRDEKHGELEEMKYGNLNIVLERGQRVYLAVFLSGYVTEGLRASMRQKIVAVEAGMGEMLDSWDGTVKMLNGLEVHLAGLISEPAVSRKGRTR